MNLSYELFIERGYLKRRQAELEWALKEGLNKGAIGQLESWIAAAKSRIATLEELVKDHE